MIYENVWKIMSFENGFYLYISASKDTRTLKCMDIGLIKININYLHRHAL